MIPMVTTSKQAAEVLSALAAYYREKDLDEDAETIEFASTLLSTCEELSPMPHEVPYMIWDGKEDMGR
jgi:hypothetical protein